jgi:ABC-type phosphate transport system substrate-binding protein
MVFLFKEDPEATITLKELDDIVSKMSKNMWYRVQTPEKQAIPVHPDRGSGYEEALRDLVSEIMYSRQDHIARDKWMREHNRRLNKHRGTLLALVDDKLRPNAVFYR